MIKEAEFAYKQAFAFCPYSPEAVFRYVNLLIGHQRIDDALLLANTCKKFDPYNGQIDGLIKQLNGWKEQQAHAIQAQTSLQQMEKEVRENPTNFQGAFNLVSTYMQLQQTNRAMQVLDGLLNNTQADVNVVFALVQAFNQLKNYPKLEATLEKLVKVAPDNPEAWYDLAAMKATLGRSPEATQSLRRALELSAQRLARDPKQLDLRAKVIGDPRFSALRQSREFQELLAPK